MKNRISLRVKLVFCLALAIVGTGLIMMLLAVVLYNIGVDRLWFKDTSAFLLVALAVSSVLAVIASSIVTHRVLSPLKKVIRAMEQIKGGDFSARIMPEPKGKGELGQLVRNFNAMTRELEGIEMLRSDFINDFSHEFKTPIVSIRGFARQLQNPNITEEQSQEYAQIIAEESDRLANMSSNILLLTQVENQHIITKKTTFSLDEQLRRSVLLFEKQWTEKNIVLNLDIDEVEYTSQEGLLSHVWNNIISNAVKFTPPGGYIDIYCKIRDGKVAVSIGDTGPGMDQDTASKVFEKFYQGDSSHSKEGNGLGLPLVKRIVFLCGGSISLKTAPGEGTVVEVLLPVTDISV